MPRKLRVLLTEATDRSKLEETFAPNLGLGYLASYLRTYLDDVEVHLVDSNLAASLSELQPDLVGISSVSQNYNRAMHQARLANKIGALVVIGGAHISAIPETLSPDMNLGVIGEGEETLAEIVRLLQACDSRPSLSHWAEVPGLVFRDLDGSLHITGPQAPIEPLDRIPFPARDLLSPDSNYHHLISSRGCPYNCVFCSSTRFWEGVRFHSPEYVVQEVEMILDKYQPQYLTFFDDLFIASRKRLRRIVELIREKGIHKRVAFQLTVRANLIDEETVDLLQQMNVFDVLIGLESGNERALRFLKGNVTLEQNQRAVDLLHAGGIGISATFIIGAPHETRQEILQTLEFIKQNPLSEARTYILTPLPGTPVWDMAETHGLVSDNMDWSQLDLTKNPNSKIIVSETLTVEELNDLYRLFERVRMRRQLWRFWAHEMSSRLGNALRHPLATCRNLLRKGCNLWHQMQQVEDGIDRWKLPFTRIKAVILGMK
jgi:anaerobic magnesium-protoporphyrin IX monomethyl ester cyclase